MIMKVLPSLVRRTLFVERENSNLAVALGDAIEGKFYSSSIFYGCLGVRRHITKSLSGFRVVELLLFETCGDSTVRGRGSIDVH